MPSLSQIPANYWPYIIIAINGLIAGWIASALFGGGGLIRDIVVGVIGSLVGGALVQYKLLNLPPSITNITDAVPGGYGTQILISTIGASIVILVARFLGGR